MQEIKSFIYGRKLSCGFADYRPIDQQINDYLKENPDRSAKSITVTQGSGWQEAFVIFDIREAQKNPGKTQNYQDKKIKTNGGNSNVQN